LELVMKTEHTDDQMLNTILVALAILLFLLTHLEGGGSLQP
jgi:hypothetical protein